MKFPEILSHPSFWSIKCNLKFQGSKSANEEKAAAALFARKMDVDVNGEAMLVCAS